MLVSCNSILSSFAFSFSSIHYTSLPVCVAQAIVRGRKIGDDGSLTWLLDEFETMSVIRSNSLRRGSPPPQPRRDSGSSGGGHENGEHPQYRYPDRYGDSKERCTTDILFQTKCLVSKDYNASIDSENFFLTYVGRNHVRSTQVLIPDSLSSQPVHPERMADLTSSLAVRSLTDTKSPTGQEGQPHRPSIENETENHVIIMIRWWGERGPMIRGPNLATLGGTAAHSHPVRRDHCLGQISAPLTYLLQREW